MRMKKCGKSHRHPRPRLPALAFPFSWILHPYEVQRIPLDDERIAFGMLEAFDFEVHVEVWPLDGFGARHLHVQHAADGRILHPRDAVVRQEVVVTRCVMGQVSDTSIVTPFFRDLRLFFVMLRTGLSEFPCQQVSGAAYGHPAPR